MTTVFNIYGVDDLESSLNSFNCFSNISSWLNFIVEQLDLIGHLEFVKQLRYFSADSRCIFRSNNIFNSCDSLRQELYGLSYISDREYKLLKNLLSEISLDQIIINFIPLLVNNDDSFEQARSILKSSPTKSIIMLDISFSFTVSSNILSNSEYVENTLLYDDHSVTQYIAAIDLADTILSKQDNSFIFIASDAGCSKISRHPNANRDDKQWAINTEPSGSVKTYGACFYIIKILLRWYKESSSTWKRVLMNSPAGGESNGWFQNGNDEIGHDYDSRNPNNVARLLAANGILPESSYDYQVHYGLRSFCLSGENIAPHTLYAIALLADADRTDSRRFFIDSRNIPVDKIIAAGRNMNPITENFNFVKNLFDFFTAFLDEGFTRSQDPIQLIFDESSLTLCSNTAVACESYTGERRRSLLDTVGWNLDNLDRYDGTNAVSSPLAKCIHHGEWGLIDPQGLEIRTKTGVFEIKMNGNEVTFLWQNTI
jgi:hypothetical protein